MTQPYFSMVIRMKLISTPVFGETQWSKLGEPGVIKNFGGSKLKIEAATHLIYIFVGSDRKK